MNQILLRLLLALIIPTVLSQTTHEFNWTLSIITANPDGNVPRPVIAINDKFPLPSIRIKRKDRVIINLVNNLEEPTALHFHGVFQNGSSFMDGAVMITQCPIPAGESFRYDFVVDSQSGTYWYHSHDAAQYGDGLRGAFIVEDADEDEGRLEYDEDVVVMLSDWYYKPSSLLVEEMNKPFKGSEPKIDSALFNETHDVDINVEQGKTYYLRLINVGMSASQYFYIEGHSFTIVEIDGVKIEPVEVDSVKLSTGQRYGVLLKTRNESNENFAIVQVTNIMMRQKFDVNWLIYNPDLEPKDKNAVKKIRPKDMNYVDDFTLRPRQSTLKLGKPDHDLSFTYDYDYFTSDNIRYYTMNGKPHLAPKVPTMNTIFSADSSTVLNPLIYGNATNAVILKKGEVVQITVNSMDHMRHPFHLHGHNFQVLAIGRREHFQYDDAAEAGFPEFPMVRDTVEVPSKGYVVLRFIADNPGVWFFHCHTEWHAVQGLGVVFIESPDYLLDNQELPNEFYQVCEAGGYEARGNAAGNKDMLNLTGEVNLDGDMETTSAETTSAETTLPAVVPTSSTEIPEEEEEKTQPNTEHQHTEVSLKKKTLVLVVYCSVMTSIAGLVALGIHRCNNKRIQKRGMLVHDYE